MLQYTITPDAPLEAVQQTRMALSAGCAWIKVDPTIVPDATVDEIITLCREAGVILTFLHSDALLDKHRVHGVHLGAEDTDPAALRQRLGGHPIIGVDVTPDTPLKPLKAADVDYVMLNGYPDNTTTETITRLRDRETAEGVELPIVVSGVFSPMEIPSIVEAGAQGIDISFSSLRGTDYQASMNLLVETCNRARR